MYRARLTNPNSFGYNGSSPNQYTNTNTNLNTNSNSPTEIKSKPLVNPFYQWDYSIACESTKKKKVKSKDALKRVFEGREVKNTDSKSSSSSASSSSTENTSKIVGGGGYLDDNSSSSTSSSLSLPSYSRSSLRGSPLTLSDMVDHCKISSRPSFIKDPELKKLASSSSTTGQTYIVSPIDFSGRRKGYRERETEEDIVRPYRLTSIPKKREEKENKNEDKDSEEEKDDEREPSPAPPKSSDSEMNALNRMIKERNRLRKIALSSKSSQAKADAGSGAEKEEKKKEEIQTEKSEEEPEQQLPPPPLSESSASTEGEKGIEGVI